VEFAQISSEHKFAHYFDYWSGIDRPKSYADFQTVLYAKENDFADDLVDKGVQIRTLSEKVWLFFFMQDEQDAIFLFEDIGSSNQGLAFRTRDAKLVETFGGIFNRYWGPAPLRPRAHRSGQNIAIPTSAEATSVGGKV
jgi:hypothetical protein